MAEKKYDIFISYRRKDTGDKAEHLKDLLEKAGFEERVSFDRENLTGIFDVELARRIDHCKDFLLVIGKNSFNYRKVDFSTEQVELYNFLGSCSQTDFEKKIVEMGPDAPLDFVRIEIARALNRKGLNIVPVVPQSSNSFDFSKLKLPDDIAEIKRHEAIFFSDNPDALFKDVIPKILLRLNSKPNSLFRRIVMSLIAVVLIGLVGWSTNFFIKNKVVKAKEEMAARCETAIKKKGIDVLCRQHLNWCPNISVKQLCAVTSILENMKKIEGGTFMQGASRKEDGTYDSYWVCPDSLEVPASEQTVGDFFIGKYEVSIEEWCDIMGQDFKKANATMPKSDVSFEDCLKFVDSLSNLTGLNFKLPTEAEWEYAARGGSNPDLTLLAGSDDPDKVAWYADNSGLHSHVRNDEDGGLYCNGLDLYDMSGNVCEWCDTPFSPYKADIPIIDREAMVIRGGSYLSEPYELSVFRRQPMNRKAHDATVGLRLVIKKR
jgi:formylglycine-generating enzyme required for sulfatase activity